MLTETEHRLHTYIHLLTNIWMIGKNKIIKRMSVPAIV